GASQSDLSVVVSGPPTYTPGSSISYTITATNAGPSNVSGARVQDTFPTGITSATWAVSYSGGGSGPTSGNNNINVNTLDLPVGATATFTVTATTAPSAAGNIVNTATISAPTGTNDPVATNNSSSTTAAQAAGQADLQITQSA